MIKNSPYDLQLDPDKLFGFYRGVVEDNNDPEKAGRVRVRVFGLHTEKNTKTEIEGIPTDELPWAEPCLPVVEGSISGFGMWGVPLQGSHVMVFFENTNPMQPRYFASMPGIPQSKESLKKSEVNKNVPTSKKDGFRDPDGKYPTRTGEPDVHRLARGESSQTLVQTKRTNLDKAVPIAYGGSWSEPDPPYNAKYPHNFVFTTHGGLTVELDSTPGSKRFHVFHPSNTYIECDNNGVLVIRNQSDKYEIVIGDRKVHVQGDNDETVDNDERVKVKGNKSTEINGNEFRRVEGDQELDLRGDVTYDVGGDFNLDAIGRSNFTSIQRMTINSSVEVVITSPFITLNSPVVTINSPSMATINSPVTTINGGLVKLAADQGTLKKLMNELTIALYNTHTHWYDPPGGGPRITGVPIQKLDSSHTTSNTEGS